VTQSRLAQTDPWTPSSPTIEKPVDTTNELQTMMQTKVEALEKKYQMIVEQKNAQIQQLMQDVRENKIIFSLMFFCSRLIHNKKHSKLKLIDIY